VLKGQREILARIFAFPAFYLTDNNVRQIITFGRNRTIIIDKCFMQRIIPCATGQYHHKKT